MPMTARYTVVDGEIIAEKRNGVRSLYVPDPQGSTVVLLDNTQKPTDTFSYWPYGEVNTRTGTTATPFQYVGTKGYYRDSTVRTYVRARYLQTATGRWLTEDPIGFKGGDWNLYRYVMNNPTSRIDPEGLQSLYGYYCGPNVSDPFHRPPPAPCDDLDAACQIHDDCWAGCAHRTGISCYVTFSSCCVGCNKALCQGVASARCEDVNRCKIPKWACESAKVVIQGIFCKPIKTFPVIPVLPLSSVADTQGVPR